MVVEPATGTRIPITPPGAVVVTVGVGRSWRMGPLEPGGEGLVKRGSQGVVRHPAIPLAMPGAIPRRVDAGQRRVPPAPRALPQAAAASAIRGPCSSAWRTASIISPASSGPIANTGVKRSELTPPWITLTPFSRMYSSVLPVPWHL